MSYYIVPVKIVLNPPDVILNDFFINVIWEFQSSYRVFFFNFERGAVRFTGLYTNEGSKNIIKYDYLFWNRSFYTAEIFYFPEPEKTVYHWVSELSVRDIIIPPLVKILFSINFSLSVTPFVIESYSVFSKFLFFNYTSDIPALLGNFVSNIKKAEPISQPAKLSDFTYKQILTLKPLSKIYALPIKQVDVFLSLFGAFEFKIEELVLENIPGDVYPVFNVSLISVINWDCDFFVTITINELVNIEQNVYNPPIIFK